MNRSYLHIALLVAISLTFAPSPRPAVAATSTTSPEIVGQLTALKEYLSYSSIPTGSPLTETELTKSITEGAKWIIASQEENGHFAYEYLPYEDTYREDDNIVRQAGTLYALAEVERSGVASDTDLATPIEASIDYLISMSKEDEYDDRTFSCVTRTKESSVCPLGATSLALLGILAHIDTESDASIDYSEIIESYKNFILASQKANGGFRNDHRIGNNIQNTKESPFSNGEAIFVLARLYKYEPDEEVRAAIDRAFTYLKDEPFHTALYLWIMAALIDMEELWPNEAYLTYAETFTDWRIDGISRHRHTERNYAAYAEGIVSAYRLLAPHLPEAKRLELRAEIDYWNQKNAQLQITTDDTYRVVRGDDGSLFMKQLPRPTQALGGFLTARHELALRIDFTQHAISAYVQTLEVYEEK